MCGARRAGLAPCRGCGLDFAASAPSGRALYPLVLPLIIALVWGAMAFDGWLHPPLWLDALVFMPLVVGLIGGAVRLAQVWRWRRIGMS